MARPRSSVPRPSTFVLPAVLAVVAGLLPVVASAQPVIDLQVLSATPTVLASEEVIYDLRVSNTGSSTATGVTLADPSGELDRELTYVSDDLGVCSAPDGDTDDRQELTCALGDIGAGTFVDISVRLEVEPDFYVDVGPQLIQSFIASDGGASTTDTETASTFVTEQADLVVQNFADTTGPLYAGQEFTYTIIVTNLGPSSARDIVVTDQMMVDEFVRANGCSLAVRTEGGAIDEFDCNFALASGVFDLATMGSNWLHPAGTVCDVPGCGSPDNDWGKIIITVNMEVMAEGGTMTTNSRVTSVTPDPDVSNNLSVNVTYVDLVADLGVTKVADTPTAGAGDVASWTVIVTNHGPSTAIETVLEDRLPPALIPKSVDVTGEIRDETSAVVNPSVGCVIGEPGDPDQPVVCDLGGMGPDWVATVTVSGMIDPAYVDGRPAGSRIRNDVEVHSETFDAVFTGQSCAGTHPCPPGVDEPNFAHAFVDLVAGADFFTEVFGAGGPDLVNQRLEFTPDGSASGYSVCVAPAGGVLPPGDLISLTDDASVEYPLAGDVSVLLYGEKYKSLHVGSNGYVTLGGGDTAHQGTSAQHFAMPRVSLQFADLNPNGLTAVRANQMADRVSVVWEDVPVFNGADELSGMVEMFLDGRIHLSYLEVPAAASVAGLSAGGGEPDLFVESDLDGYPVCPMVFADDFESGDVSAWSYVEP